MTPLTAQQQAQVVQLDRIARAAAKRRPAGLDPDDAVQIARLELCEVVKSHDPSRGSIESFAYVCCRSRLIDAARGESRRGITRAPSSTGARFEAMPNDLPTEHEFTDHETAAAVWREVGRLPAKTADCLKRVYLRGESTREAAAANGLNVPAARERMNRVIRHLRREMGAKS